MSVVGQFGARHRVPIPGGGEWLGPHHLTGAHEGTQQRPVGLRRWVRKPVALDRSDAGNSKVFA